MRLFDASRSGLGNQHDEEPTPPHPIISTEDIIDTIRGTLSTTAGDADSPAVAGFLSGRF